MSERPLPFAKPGGRLSRWLLPLATFILLSAATLTAWQWQSRLYEEARELAGAQESAAITAEIRDRLRLHALFLRTMQAFAVTHSHLNLETWQRFANEVSNSSNLSELFVLAYAPSIPQKDIDGFLKATRQQAGRHDFRIHPEPTGPFATPVIFLAPNRPELRMALGFNLVSEAVRREAIERSVVTQDITLSGPITLINDTTDPRPAFLLVHALYKPRMPLNNSVERELAFSGVVLTSYRVDEFLSSLTHVNRSSFTLQVFDEPLAASTTAPQAPTLIYDSAPDSPVTGETPSFHHEVDFGGRNWILEFRPRSDPTRSGEIDTPTLILFGGFAGSLLLALLIFHTTNHRARAEAYADDVTRTLRQHSSHLNELVSERTVRLHDALQEAQAANHAKSEFLANMSHELRTPMHAILSFSELGSSRAQDCERGKLAQYFQRIEQSAHRLLGLINELLDLSKLEAGHVDLQLSPISLPEIIEGAHAQLESLLIGRHLHLEIVDKCPECEVVGDAKRISQVVINLLSNAIKFSPEGGSIRIEIVRSELPAGRRLNDTGTQPAVAIRFLDNGIGIPEAELLHIFEKFVQSSTTRSGAGGTGLGLAISQAIVLQHRGTIAATNNAGSGACFTVTLPTYRRTGGPDSDE